MNIAIFAYSRTGCKTARRICMALPEAETLCYAVPRLAEPGFLPLEKAVYGAAFSEMDALIFVGAAGIAVREIAPYVRDKRTDPAVLGLDERANFVIPLLSGHIGGANALARRLAAALGATAVVTTATDVNGKFSVDTWAAEHGCAISDMGGAKQISAEILEHSVPVCSDFPIQGPLPDGLVLGESGELGIYVGYRCSAPFMHTLRLVPRVLRVGVGCRKGISREAVEAAIQTAFASHDLDLNAVKGVYSIDLKRQEAGLLDACEEHGWSATFYTAEELRAVTGEFTESPFVQGVTGIGNVCERAAMLGAERLLVRKCAGNGVTIAVALPVKITLFSAIIRYFSLPGSAQQHGNRSLSFSCPAVYDSPRKNAAKKAPVSNTSASDARKPSRERTPFCGKHGFVPALEQRPTG